MGRKGLYTIDPEQEVDEPTLILVFLVPGEIFTEVPDGYKGHAAHMDGDVWRYSVNA